MPKTPKPNAGARDFARPLTTVDVAIFAVVEGCLQVLLVKRPQQAREPFPGLWALPGGFVDVQADASLHACALRKLREKTGVKTPYLEQLGSWGDDSRDPRGWSATHVYFALIAAATWPQARGDDTVQAQWFAVSDASSKGPSVKPKLAFDHSKLLAAAVQRLRAKVEYTSLPTYLLPQEFTLPELQLTYEIVLGRRLDKSAFRARVAAVDLVVPTGRMRPGETRPAQLYRLAKPDAAVYFQRALTA
jgi:8-oxo-dGTP diphosphatase